MANFREGLGFHHGTSPETRKQIYRAAHTLYDLAHIASTKIEHDLGFVAIPGRAHALDHSFSAGTGVCTGKRLHVY
jgi:hypothetical protein